MSGRRMMLAGLLCAALLCTGCVSSVPTEKTRTGESLPQVRSGPEAPIGDSQTAREVKAVLYLPDAGAERLTSVVDTVVIESGQTKHEAYVTKLLELIDESPFYAGDQQLRLSTVSNAVETTRDLVTVNMHTSMRALTAQEQFALRVAIINTLSELQDTTYVNILVNGRDIGLDVAETIPTGVMTRYPGTDVATYWGQLDAQRTSIDGELQKTVALYFASSDGSALLGEVRSMVFESRDHASMARAIISELAKGAVHIDGARQVVPPQTLLAQAPELQDRGDGPYMVLRFRPELIDFLEGQNSTLAMTLSSICYTLTSFIPKLEGIIAYIGDEMVTDMILMNGIEWELPSGQLTRESVAALAADVCTVYYPMTNGKGLYPVSRPIAQRLRTQPRALLRELMQPPEEEGLQRALPEAITDADILGLQIRGDTALLNVTSAFAQACSLQSQIQERNMVYAIVNTLTELEGVTRVRFYVEGVQTALAGHLFMGGDFMRHTGLIYSGTL